MKSFIKGCLVFVAAVAVAAFTANAQDNNSATGSSASAATAPAHKAHKGKRYTGNVTSIDSAAKTITFAMTSGKTHTIGITSKTRIRKDGEPATLDDVKTGDKISGAYRLDDAQKWVATTLNIGAVKKKSAPPAQ